MQVLEEFDGVLSTNTDYSRYTSGSVQGHVFTRKGQMQHRFHVCSSDEPKESVCALKTTGCRKSTGDGETWQGTVSAGVRSATRSAPLS